MCRSNGPGAERCRARWHGVRVVTWGMSSFDSALLSNDMGAELSGVIGFPTLRELVVSIDYRDNLVHVVYDPASGVHAH